jgi:hypothetical protein
MLAHRGELPESFIQVPFADFGEAWFDFVLTLMHLLDIILKFDVVMGADAITELGRIQLRQLVTVEVFTVRTLCSFHQKRSLVDTRVASVDHHPTGTMSDAVRIAVRDGDEKG